MTDDVEDFSKEKRKIKKRKKRKKKEEKGMKKGGFDGNCNFRSFG